MFNPTYGEVNLEEVAKIIKDFINEDVTSHYAIYIGSDSQNTFYTKMVTVIAIHREGHGGKYFYEIYKYDKIKDLRIKLFTETQLSLEMADKLFNAFDKINFDYLQDNISFTIHVDCGNNGPSSSVIPEVIGYVHSMGYNVEVKPNSPIASCIADRISK